MSCTNPFLSLSWSSLNSQPRHLSLYFECQRIFFFFSPCENVNVILMSVSVVSLFLLHLRHTAMLLGGKKASCAIMEDYRLKRDLSFVIRWDPTNYFFFWSFKLFLILMSSSNGIKVPSWVIACRDLWMWMHPESFEQMQQLLMVPQEAGVFLSFQETQCVRGSSLQMRECVKVIYWNPALTTSYQGRWVCVRVRLRLLEFMERFKLFCVFTHMTGSRVFIEVTDLEMDDLGVL